MVMHLIDFAQYHFGMISLVTRNFHGKFRKCARKQSRLSSMILDLYITLRFIIINTANKHTTRKQKHFSAAEYNSKIICQRAI